MKRVVLFLFSIFLVMLPMAARADVSGACTITMNGVDANSLATPATALQVEPTDTIDLVARSSDGGSFTGHSVSLEYSGIKWKVDERTDTDPEWTGTVNVADYSKYGVGLYKAFGDSQGVSCSGWAFVKVGGDPLKTPAGLVAAGTAGVGAALGGAAIAKAAKRPRKRAQALVPELDLAKGPAQDFGPMQAAYQASPEQATQPYNSYVGKRAAAGISAASGRGCGGIAGPPGPAILMTLAFMASGMGSPGAAAPMADADGGPPVVKVRPVVSVMGVIGALLFGLGTLVLLQQYSIMFPTGLFTVLWLLLWVVVEVIVSTLATRRGLKKVLAVFAAAEAAGPGQPA